MQCAERRTQFFMISMVYLEAAESVAALRLFDLS